MSPPPTPKPWLHSINSPGWKGIIPALESSHALAWATRLAAGMEREQNILVNLSGRGDKDIEAVARFEGADLGIDPGIKQ